MDGCDVKRVVRGRDVRDVENCRGDGVRRDVTEDVGRTDLVEGAELAHVDACFCLLALDL